MRKTELRVLAVVGALTFGVGLNACANFAQNLPQYATDAADIAAGLTAAVGDLEQAHVLPPATAALIDTSLAAVNASATAVAKDSVLAQTESDVVKLTSAANVLIASLQTIPGIPSSDKGLIDAASTLLPVVEAQFGIIVPATAAEGHMTPAQARWILGNVRH